MVILISLINNTELELRMIIERVNRSWLPQDIIGYIVEMDIFFFRVVDDFFFYIIGSGFRKLFKIYAEDYWDGISLFYLRTIDVDGVVISIYRERDKMSISEMSDVIKRRIRDNKSEIIER